MNDLGLGIVVSMKDAFSSNAARIQSSMLSLDQSVAAASERMTRNLDRIQKGTMMIGAGLTMLALPAGLVASTVATQRSLAELASLGVKDLKALEDAAEAFTNQWAGSTKADFLTAAYDVRSALAGLSDEAVGTFATMAALTGKATKATTAEMVGTFTTAYGIFKPIMADMSDIAWAEAFSGGLAQTVAAFKTNGKEMADAIKNIGAVGAASNIPLEEQLAILGQLQTTMPGSEAGTLYKAFVMKAAEAGKELGLEFVDAGGRLKSVILILEEVRGKFPDLSQAAAQVEIKKAFGSDEAVKFLLQMSQGMVALKGNIEGVGKAMRQGTALTLEMARAMNADIGSQFGVLAQQVQNLAEILGATLLPVVLPVLKQLGRLADAAQAVAKEVPGLTRAVLIASATIGAVLITVGALVAAVGTIGVMVPAIQAGFVSLSAGVASAGSAIATWFLPVTLAIAAVVAGVVFLRRAWESNFGGIRDFVVGAYDRVRMVFDGLRQLMGSLSNGTGQMSAELAGKLEDAGLIGFVVTVFRAYYRVREALAALWGAFSAAFGRVKAIVEPAVRTLLAAYQDLARAIGGAIASITGAAGMADVSAFRQVGQVLGKLLGIVALVGAYILRFLVGGLVGVIRIVAPVIRLVGWLGGVLVSAFRVGFQAAAKFFLPLRMLIEALRHVGRMVGIVWGVLMGEVSLGEGFRAAGESLREFLLAPLRWLQDVAAATWRALCEGIAFVAGLFARIGGAIVAGIQRLPIVAAVRGIVAEIGALFRGERSFLEAGTRIVTTLTRGLLAAATLPVRVVRGLLARLVGMLSGFAEGGRSAGRRIVAALAAGLAGLIGLPGRLLMRALAPVAGLVAGAVGRIVGASQAAVGRIIAPFRWLLGVASVVWQQFAAGARIGWSPLVGLGASALDALAAPFRFLGSVAGSVFGGVLSAASGVWQNLVGWAAALAAVLVSPFQPLIDAAGTAWAAIRAGAEALFGALAGIVGGWWDRAKGVFDAVRSLMSLVGEGAAGAKVASPALPPGHGTSVGAAMPTPPVLPTSVPSLEPPRVLPASPVPALVSPSLTPPVPALPVAGGGLSPVPDAEGGIAASLRGMEQAVIRTMATLVRVLEAAHAKIAAIGVGSARAAATPVQTRSAPRVPPVRIDVPRTPPIAPRPVPLPVRTPPIVPAVPSAPAPVKPPAPRPRPEVVERGVWGRTRPAVADRALQVVERTANVAQRARGGVRTTASEWERVGRNASRGRIDEALLGAVRSVRSTRQRSEGLARTAGDLWRTIRGPKSPEAAAAPEPTAPPAVPAPEAAAAPASPTLPRVTPPVVPAAAAERRGGLLGASLAALVAASTPPFVPPAGPPGAPQELPVRMEARDHVPEPRAELLAAARPGPSPQDASAAGRSAGDPVPALLQALIAKVDALADRPIDLTVSTRIDGREVAQAVYKDLRERKIRNYETL